MVKLTIKNNCSGRTFEATIVSSTLNKILNFLEGCYGSEIAVFADELFQGELDEDEFDEMKGTFSLHFKEVFDEESAENDDDFGYNEYEENNIDDSYDE